MQNGKCEMFNEEQFAILAVFIRFLFSVYYVNSVVNSSLSNRC